jgi:hypothetical protein
MPEHRLTRRQVLQLGAAALPIALFGCDKKQVGDAVGDALIAIGGLVLKIPHLSAKVIGAMLISGGSSLKIYMAATEGQKKEVTIQLTTEQQEKIQRALAEGQKLTVTQPNGEKQSFDLKK